MLIMISLRDFFHLDSQSSSSLDHARGVPETVHGHAEICTSIPYVDIDRMRRHALTIGYASVSTDIFVALKYDVNALLMSA